METQPQPGGIKKIMLMYHDHLDHMLTIRQAVMAAANPEALIDRILHLQENTIRIGDVELHLKATSRLFLIAFGKASAAMSRAVLRILKPSLAEGLIAVPHDYQGSLPDGMRIFHAGHPLPDESSMEAGRVVADILARTKEDDIVLVLISGGGSAMLELPRPGITLQDMRKLNTLLLHSGAPIASVNIVRRAISQIKAGGLARMAAPAKVVALIISDVIGDRLSAIASGPTVLRAPKPEQVRAVLQQYQLWNRVPNNIRNSISQTRSPSSRTSRPVNIIIGNNRLVIRAAQKTAHDLGFPTKILTSKLQGEAKIAGRRLATSLRRAPEPHCLIAGGETTVHIQGDGHGGRNQELALAAALTLDGIPNCALMALATDGVDGPTSAAGAIVTGNTIPRARQLGLDPEGALKKNDSFPFHQALRSTISTGPSGTNLNDLVVGLKYASP